MTEIPASFKIRNPSPFTFGCGSRMAATTRRIPDRTMASAHEGVRPLKEQGSTLQYKVEPSMKCPFSFLYKVHHWVSNAFFSFLSLFLPA